MVSSRLRSVRLVAARFISGHFGPARLRPSQPQTEASPTPRPSHAQMQGGGPMPRPSRSGRRPVLLPVPHKPRGRRVSYAPPLAEALVLYQGRRIFWRLYTTQASLQQILKPAIGRCGRPRNREVVLCFIFLNLRLRYPPLLHIRGLGSPWTSLFPHRSVRDKKSLKMLPANRALMELSRSGLSSLIKINWRREIVLELGR